jgi:hypothetical protein
MKRSPRTFRTVGATDLGQRQLECRRPMTASPTECELLGVFGEKCGLTRILRVYTDMAASQGHPINSGLHNDFHRTRIPRSLHLRRYRGLGLPYQAHAPFGRLRWLISTAAPGGQLTPSRKPERKAAGAPPMNSFHPHAGISHACSSSDIRRFEYDSRRPPIRDSWPLLAGKPSSSPVGHGNRAEFRDG